MKKIFAALSVILMIILSESSGAQSKNDFVFNDSSTPGDISLKSPDETKSEKKLTYVKITQVNISAVRHFIRYHKNVSDERWFKTKDGYIANFLSKGIDTRIAYDDKGRWLYNLLVYTEDRLPLDIRHRVKSEYYDDSITEINQYETSAKTVYIILMKDQQSNEKILEVNDNEMKEITTHGKN